MRGGEVQRTTTDATDETRRQQAVIEAKPKQRATAGTEARQQAEVLANTVLEPKAAEVLANTVTVLEPTAVDRIYECLGGRR